LGLQPAAAALSPLVARPANIPPNPLSTGAYQKLFSD